MLFLAAVLNYIDRNLLGMLAPSIKADLHLSNEQYGHVIDLFLIAYVFSYLFSGRVVDRLGARAGMALFIGFWSIANALTGVARSAASLGAFRFMLGLGEAGGWTASPKVVADWFRPGERALAIGIYSIGSTVGATIAPFLVFVTATSFGWRGAFFITGLLGLAWIVPWVIVARRAPASASTAIGAAPAEQKGAGGEAALWVSILSRPAVWGLMLTRLMTDSTWYFYQFWMPTYLHDVRGVAQRDLWVMAFIFLAADIGFIGGGFLSDRLVKRGASPAAGRTWLMLAAACLIPVSALVPFAPSVPLVLACGAVVALAHCVWLGNLSTLVVDIVPQRTLATTFGFIGAGSAAGGILMNKLVVWAIGSYSYDRVFFVMACLHPLALLLVWRLRKSAPAGG
jgi:ACS family hexuronate transporter-like MFS transporter